MLRSNSAGGTQIAPDWPVADPTHSLDQLLNLSIKTQHPIIVTAEGKPVGVVTKNALLRGIRGETAQSTAAQ